MSYLSLKKPMVIQNMHHLEESYALLRDRRRNLVAEIEKDTREAKLRQLRRIELGVVDTQLHKIEKFLKRYGFITKESTL